MAPKKETLKSSVPKLNDDNIKKSNRTKSTVTKSSKKQKLSNNYSIISIDDETIWCNNNTNNTNITTIIPISIRQQVIDVLQKCFDQNYNNRNNDILIQSIQLAIEPILYTGITTSNHTTPSSSSSSSSVASVASFIRTSDRDEIRRIVEQYDYRHIKGGDDDDDDDEDEIYSSDDDRISEKNQQQRQQQQKQYLTYIRFMNDIIIWFIERYYLIQKAYKVYTLLDTHHKGCIVLEDIYNSIISLDTTMKYNNNSADNDTTTTLYNDVIAMMTEFQSANNDTNITKDDNSVTSLSFYDILHIAKLVNL